MLRRPVGIPTDAYGYARDARCGLAHSGNHGLIRARRGFWQCAGCGTFFTDAQVQNPKARMLGSGGVIRVEKSRSEQ